MKKVTVFLAAFVLLALMVVPAFAWSGVDFRVVDGETLQPWGTVAGQKYRIIVLINNVSAYNVEFTTPADAPLDFSCAWGASCNGSIDTFPMPVANDNVKIIITFDGTNGNPSPIQREFDWYADYSVNYSIDEKLTINGPTAVSLQNIAADSNSVTGIGVALVVVMLAGVTFVMFRRREVA